MSDKVDARYWKTEAERLKAELDEARQSLLRIYCAYGGGLDETARPHEYEVAIMGGVQYRLDEARRERDLQRGRAEWAERGIERSRRPTCHCDHPHGECVTCGCPLLAESLVLQEFDPVCPTCHAPWAGLERLVQERARLATLLGRAGEALKASALSPDPQCTGEHRSPVGPCDCIGERARDVLREIEETTK